MPIDPQVHISRILAAEGQFDADPTFDHQRQRLQKQEVENQELNTNAEMRLKLNCGVVEKQILLSDSNLLVEIRLYSR